MTDKLDFSYFEAPESEMRGLVKESCECSLCATAGRCFELDFAISSELSEGQLENKVGCVRCLRAGRFEFEHDTDVGMLDENGLSEADEPSPSDFRGQALIDLRRTPQFLSWQEELWLSHCDDFMVYMGLWNPPDFVRHHPQGDGKAAFEQITRDPELRFVWGEIIADQESIPDSWSIGYYVFRCRHCGELAGNWDCD